MGFGMNPHIDKVAHQAEEQHLPSASRRHLSLAVTHYRGCGCLRLVNMQHNTNKAATLEQAAFLVNMSEWSALYNTESCKPSRGK
mmetsp:Transcript_2069/g.5648  ORF Transcript_2069/g.5648 Transcript_2069/m.5648 type:complete len:85 (+) Transcript_2069:182-436(+)